MTKPNEEFVPSLGADVYREMAADMRSTAEENLAEAARWGLSAFLFEAVARYKEAGDAEGLRVANELCGYVKHPDGGAE